MFDDGLQSNRVDFRRRHDYGLRNGVSMTIHRPHLRSVWTAILAVVALFGTAPAAAQPLSTTFLELRAAADAAAQNARGARLTTSTPFGAAAALPISHGRPGTYYAYYYEMPRPERVGNLVRRLEELIGSRDDQPPQLYVIGLTHDIDLLRRAAAATDPVERESYLAAVEGDLETRVSHLASNPSGYVVSLSVITKRNGQVVNGYRVGLVPIMWSGSSPAFLLRSESSPAQDDVMAGRYEFVLTRGNSETRLGPYRVGLTGERSERFEVSIP